MKTEQVLKEEVTQDKKQYEKSNTLYRLTTAATEKVSMKGFVDTQTRPNDRDQDFVPSTGLSFLSGKILAGKRKELERKLPFLGNKHLDKKSKDAVQKEVEEDTQVLI